MSIEDLNIVVPSESMTEDDQSVLNEDLKELGEQGVEKAPPVEKQETDKPESEEEVAAREAAEDSNNELSEEERETIRERRRQERHNRKNFRKEKEDSYRREIDGLRRQLAEVNEWKNTVEQRRVHSGAAQIDKALKDSMDAVAVAKRALKEATETQNGDALVEAQELYYAASRRAENLTNVKQRMAQQMQQRPQQNIDPMIVQQAKTWMDNKSWYDPTGKDPDSRIALTIDNAMADEGWNPRTPEYWTELDSRLKKYLPHRYQQSAPAASDKPRPPTGGSNKGASSNAGSSFTLSPERVRAMKEAGMWEDPDKRKSMIKRYIEQDRSVK